MKVLALQKLRCGVTTAHTLRLGYRFRLGSPRWGLEFLRLAAQGYVRLSPEQVTLTQNSEGPLLWRREIDPAVTQIVAAAFGHFTTISFDANRRPKHKFENVERAAALDTRDRQWQVDEGLRAYDRGWSPIRLFALPSFALTLVSGGTTLTCQWFSAQQIGLGFITACCIYVTLFAAFGKLFRIAAGGLEVRQALRELRSLGVSACSQRYYSEAMLPWIWLVNPHRIKNWLALVPKPSFWDGPDKTWASDLYRLIKMLHSAFPVQLSQHG